MEFPSLEELKARQTRKWTVYDDDVLPLWIAESDFPTDPHVKKAIRDAVDNEAFGYTPGSSGLPEALADFYQERFGWRPDPANIRTIGDVIRGMLLGLQYFTRPDSPVLVPVPTYPPFLELPETAGRRRVDISAEGGLDLDEVEAGFKAGAGALLLAAPNNPLGYLYDEPTLRALIDLADRYDARLIVDEIHAPIVFEGRHIPPASLGPVAAKVCFTVTATSKAWNIAGLKCAQVILTNEEDVAVWNSLTGVAKDGTGTLGVFAAEACYSRGGETLDAQVAHLRRTRDWVADELEKAVPGLRATRPAATYLMWLDFSDTAIAGEERPAAWLRRHARVALNEGTSFGPGGAHHARLNFATSEEILAEAISRIATAFEELGR
ncbi:MalY/PatB family protein [Corynebacterium guangdongense]|uniref:cysteine-S-conjugate beta-lyase n=1 Tax=Corynebacterium guangdongense TaxID=1783348 RepID=A0ABU1ZZ04_9CORY|nr:aminotransferase class I/II-fold pyridoxal phosphate-dependent enzyme [Corynebacterium guangdongense]MDR7329990.1 cystathionine beta-lyase [Corynebacterium guangdongense]WJZ18548.1 Cystathionine beta-lyase PatB [Corynebacterium guangdongense]